MSRPSWELPIDSTLARVGYWSAILISQLSIWNSGKKFNFLHQTYLCTIVKKRLCKLIFFFIFQNQEKLSKWNNYTHTLIEWREKNNQIRKKCRSLNIFQYPFSSIHNKWIQIQQNHFFLHKHEPNLNSSIITNKNNYISYLAMSGVFSNNVRVSRF